MTDEPVLEAYHGTCRAAADLIVCTLRFSGGSVTLDIEEARNYAVIVAQRHSEHGCSGSHVEPAIVRVRVAWRYRKEPVPGRSVIDVQPGSPLEAASIEP